MRAVVAFGGNAIARSSEEGTFEQQLRNVNEMSQALATLVEHGLGIVITHGNGPQVGRIALQQEFTATQGIPPMPFHASGAMSQGLIGYMLQQSLSNVLRARRIDTPCLTVVTQVVVDESDGAFRNPTKPVGPFYSVTEAKQLREGKGWIMVEDAGRGYRRVVPSPDPLFIVESPAIAGLVDAGALVIAAGGGGIPVVEDHIDGFPLLRGVDAVIDKDRASARLAALIGVDTLVLLTDVDRVAVGYGSRGEKWLDRVSMTEMREHLSNGEFPPGSMGPKVESAIRFIEDGGTRAIITSARNLVRAVTEGGGTEIIREIATLASVSQLPGTAHG